MHIDPVAAIAARYQRLVVYPLYFASRVKKGLLAAKEADAEGIIAAVGEVESLGNSRYAIRASDESGTTYRITVEVAS
jgi:RNase P/RNase MRP subunit POP5